MTALADAYTVEADRLAADRRPVEPEWVARARRAGLERFERTGFPTTHDEDWRFISVAPIAEGRFALPGNGPSAVSRATLDAFRWAGESAATLVFVNGQYVPAASSLASQSGLRVESLAHALAQPATGIDGRLNGLAGDARNPFTMLNTAFLADGAVILVPDNLVIDAPIQLLFFSGAAAEPIMSHPRVLVAMGENSQAAVVEIYAPGEAGSAPSFTNVVTEITAGCNARLHHYRIQCAGAASLHTSATYVRAAADANVTCHTVTLAGLLVRNDITVVMDGAGSECTLNGLYVADGSRVVDNHTTIDHAKPHGSSREIYKGILADRARAVFNGKIVVRPDAQKTDAKQTSKALLLSEDAQINTNPQLEIFANDVKCTHGAAVGQMDDEAIFYLRARGLDEVEARQMLVRAFASDVLNRVPHEPLRARLDRELSARIPERRR